MSEKLYTVDQAAERLNLHPRTLLRYIREGRLPATRLGKAYRIVQSELEAFAGIAAGRDTAGRMPRATAILDIPAMNVDDAERIATFLQATALTGDAGTPPLQVETAFDPQSGTMKIVLIGTPGDTGEILQMLHLRLRSRT